MVARDPKERTIRLTSGRAALLVFCIGMLAASAGIPTRASYGARATGDEPQYLITAISLVQDGDLDVADEIAERAYEPFHEVTLDRQTEPLEGGREVSPHDPLLPVLLTAPVAIGGWVGAKLFMSALHGVVAALVLLIAHKRFAAPLPTATAILGLFAAAAPMAVYGQQIYPEIPAALCVAVAIWASLGTLRTGGVLALAGGVVALPWLSIKYAPVAATLAGIGMWILFREGKRVAVVALAVGLALAGGVYIAAHLAWYGGLTSYATGDHFVSSGEFSVVGTNVNVLGRSSRSIGLLVDRGFGLVAWQPLYLLMIPAAAFAAARRYRGWAILLAVIVAGWLNATFVALTMHGWWWPGRQTVVVLPAVMLVVIVWVTRVKRVRSTAYALGGVGVVTYIWLAIEGARGRLTWVVDFFETSAPTYAVIRSVLPDYMEGSTITWVLHGLWLVIAALLILLGWRSGRPTRPSRMDPSRYDEARTMLQTLG